MRVRKAVKRNVQGGARKRAALCEDREAWQKSAGYRNGMKGIKHGRRRGKRGRVEGRVCVFVNVWMALVHAPAVSFQLR